MVHAARRVVAGVLFLWIGVMMIVEEPAGVASIGAGAILLAAAGLRRAAGRRAGFVLTMSGLLLLLLGLNDLNGDDRGIPLAAVALISFGALILVRAFTRGTASRSGVEIVVHQWPRRRP